ncbi:MAG: hypothetical protein RI883_2161 [Bacteroidota bacterium]|jgi:hypothetical protein
MIFNSQSAQSAICTALGNGNWSNPANWSCGAVPSCGDLILIPAGMTVNVNTMVDLDENSSPACSTATFITVFGTLQFVTGFKISLACGSGVDIMPGGSMLPGGGGGSSNWLKICNIIEWKTSNGPVIGFVHFGSPIPLTVEFISLSVNQSQNTTNLTWIVASERENDLFKIDISTDDVNWINLDNVNSVGDHNDEYTYNLEVENLKIYNQTYFRLSQTDKNGINTILAIKTLNVKKDQITLFPNPINNRENLTVSVQSSQQINSECFIYNSAGQVIVKENIELEKGTNAVHFEISNIEQGIYFVKLSNVEQTQALKLIVR